MRRRCPAARANRTRLAEELRRRRRIHDASVGRHACRPTLGPINSSCTQPASVLLDAPYRPGNFISRIVRRFGSMQRHCRQAHRCHIVLRDRPPRRNLSRRSLGRPALGAHVMGSAAFGCCQHSSAIARPFPELLSVCFGKSLFDAAVAKACDGVSRF